MKPTDTNRLTFREITDADISDLMEVWANPHYSAHVATRENTQGNAKALIRRSLRSSYRDGFGLWAIIDKQSNSFVGYGGLKPPQPGKPAEIKYFLKQDFEKKGYATEAALRFIEYGFQNLKLLIIVAVIARGNEGSTRVATNVGLGPVAGYEFAITKP